ncbi:hypothetical protein HOF92_06535 [bacterium]|jgi:hypothetical protein|nr:hypothetical protein [bacterium]
MRPLGNQHIEQGLTWNCAERKQRSDSPSLEKDAMTLGEYLHLWAECTRIPFAYFGTQEIFDSSLQSMNHQVEELGRVCTRDMMVYSTYDPTITCSKPLRLESFNGVFLEFTLGSFLSYVCGQWGFHLLCFLREQELSEIIYLPDLLQDPEIGLSRLKQEGLDLRYRMESDRLIVSGNL